VEHGWYDGPQEGLAAVDGRPHYFRCVHDQPPGHDFDDEFLVWPADDRAFALEREQWRIFVAWRQGPATLETDPTLGGGDAPSDELTELLAPFREPPAEARRLKAEFEYLDWPKRYEPDGPDYRVRWWPIR